MPTEQEIRDRALRDLTAAFQTRDQTKAAIEAEQPVLLAGLATVRASMATRDAAVEKADAALAGALERIRIQQDKEEIAALEKEGADGKAAALLAEAEVQAAQLAYPVEKKKADDAYNEAYKAAGHLVGPQADEARKAARAAHDAAIDEADRKCQEAIDAAREKCRVAIDITAKDEHDAAKKAAFDKAVTSRETSEERHRNAVAAAEAALAKALGADPQAAAVVADCARRLKEADDRYEADCAAIMERQARELEELRRGGTS